MSMPALWSSKFTTDVAPKAGTAVIRSVAVAAAAAIHAAGRCACRDLI
jgi:hypothetical protein